MEAHNLKSYLFKSRTLVHHRIFAPRNATKHFFAALCVKVLSRFVFLLPCKEMLIDSGHWLQGKKLPFPNEPLVHKQTFQFLSCDVHLDFMWVECCVGRFAEVLLVPVCTRSWCRKVFQLDIARELSKQLPEFSARVCTLWTIWPLG